MASQQKPTNGIYHIYIVLHIMARYNKSLEICLYVNMYVCEIVPVNPAECFELPVTTSEFPASPSPPHSETQTHLFKPLDI